MRDSLADVIAAVVEDDMWEDRHRRLFAPRVAKAVRAHLAAIDPLKALCDRYGLPNDPDVLVRHLEAGAALRATMEERLRVAAVLDAEEAKYPPNSSWAAGRLAVDNLRDAFGLAPR